MDASAAASELKLETSEKMSDPVIHAFHKLGKAYKESVPIAVEALEGPRRTFILLPSIPVF